jgi:hypothetical protein
LSNAAANGKRLRAMAASAALKAGILDAKRALEHDEFRLKRLLLTSPRRGEVAAHRQMRGG